MKQPMLALLLGIALFSCKGPHNPEKDNANTVVRLDSSVFARPDKAVNPYVSIDISPMDMSYFPVDYPKIKASGAASAPPLARVIYSRPHLQGRTLFKDILKYGEPWRLGANESTEIELYSDAVIEGKKVKAGRYILYCIPENDKWTLVLNSNLDTWGLHPDASKDVIRVSVPIHQTDHFLEYFTIVFQGKDKIAQLIMGWEKTEAKLSLQF